METLVIGKLIQGPFGPSKRMWNNRHCGTNEADCELCGTSHPELPGIETYTVDTFLGSQIVEECCGSVFDQLYEEIGEEFAIAFLKDFRKNPLDPKFGELRIVLEDTIPILEKCKIFADKT